MIIVLTLCQINHDRICGIRIESLEHAIINIFSIYMPARGCEGDLEECLDELGAILENSEYGSHNILCGDFNADIGNMGGPKSNKKPDGRGKQLVNFIVKYDVVAMNLTNVSAGPLNTHYGPTGQTCIDYIFVPNAIFVNCLECHTLDLDPLNTSDHIPVCVTMDLGAIPRGCTEGVCPVRIRWDKISQANLIQRYQCPIGSDLGNILEQNKRVNPTSVNVDNLVDEVIHVIKTHEKVIPRTKFKKNVKSYWCNELTQLKRERVKVFNEWSSAGGPRDPADPLFIRNKETKKHFRKRLKIVSREYDEKKVEEAAKSAEFDRTLFWRMLKRERSGPKLKTPSVKNLEGKIVHDVDEILEVWKKHFSALGIPSESPEYDKEHFAHVTTSVDRWFNMDDEDEFTEEPFLEAEVKAGLAKLNGGKAPGADGITKEHLINAGPVMIRALTLLFNWVMQTEYMPLNFRRGIQIPLYKGKNSSITDVNNYRGITLLSTFNKLFEVLIWERMSTWWRGGDVLSHLQGACRKGISCVHTSMVLQETISTLLESNSKVFVTYLDVSKAFDGVWIDGLFYRLRELGICGRTWRLLYSSYIDFQCQVRIQNRYSNWYSLNCGIHQGGYLSLFKYLVFINSLLVSLEASGLCCAIQGIPVSPLGYADDLAAATISKMRMDRVLNKVYQHSNTWRYRFNPAKSAVLVYGETDNENKENSRYRVFRLGGNQIKEKNTYDHLGLKNSRNGVNKDRLNEKVKKGRKALNAASGLGLKPGGLTIKACSILFWAMTVPIVTFSSELWILNDEDVNTIECFQRYAGRRIQRFNSRSPNETSYAGLGWIRLEYFIYIKKLLFIRSIAILENDTLYKSIFINRLIAYQEKRELSRRNEFKSPVLDMFKIAENFGLLTVVKGMLEGTKIYSKSQWKDIVWSRAWEIDDQDWRYRTIFFKSTENIRRVVNNVRLLIWWQLGDHRPELMYQCETMVKIICKASELKCDKNRHNREIGGLYCELCDDMSIENGEHIIMHCRHLQDIRNNMLKEIDNLEKSTNIPILSGADDMLSTLMGHLPENASGEIVMPFLQIVAMHVYRMYRRVLMSREGIG